jgi:hypothetical protein
MTIWTQTTDNSRVEDEAFADAPRMERFSYRREGECPVRAHASRTRARMRSLGGPAARRKSRSFNGAHRRLRTFA